MNRNLIFATLLGVWSVQAADQPTPPAPATVHETAPVAEAVPVQPHAPGIESPGYVWNDIKGEELLALKATGDATRGADAYIVCQGCHGSDALGDAAGFYPRLAGQHASVLIKQMADVRAGRRDNPKMYPFATEHVVSTQEIADIAAYLHSLPVPPTHGQGPGADLTGAADLYKKDCETCHGPAGQGKGDKFYPKLADQHFAYLVRQALALRDGLRRNANPDMVEAIKPYTDAEVVAVIDYVSRLPAPGN